MAKSKLRFRSVAAWLAATKAAGLDVMLLGITKIGAPQLQFDDRHARGHTIQRRVLALMWWGRDHQGKVEDHLRRHPLAGLTRRTYRAVANREDRGFLERLRPMAGETRL